MGLFINKDEHPDVFKNKDEIQEQNQGFTKTDYLSELVKEHEKAYSSLNKSIEDLNKGMKQKENLQAGEWKRIGKQISEIRVNHIEQMQSLENEGLMNQQLIDQINVLAQSNREIVSKLEQYESTFEQLTLKLNEQAEWQKQISDQMSIQGAHHNKVMSRLDNQEALTEKLVRQMDHIRASLFERTNYLVEKIENGYHLTSSYVYKIMTGSDQPLTFLMMNQKKGEEEKSTE